MKLNNNIYKKKIINFKFSEKIMVENISNLQEGTNHFKDYIIFKNKEHFRIYDRICDHNGGKLITKPDKKIICPLHGWQFDPKSGRIYTLTNNWNVEIWDIY